jgi:hypothetical protein
MIQKFTPKVKTKLICMEGIYLDVLLIVAGYLYLLNACMSPKYTSFLDEKT